MFIVVDYSYCEPDDLVDIKICRKDSGEPETFESYSEASNWAEGFTEFFEVVELSNYSSLE